MPIYKQTTEITNIDDIWTGVDRDIVEIYFGDKNVFTVWRVYEGTLPATINANGSDMRQYQIYGNTGGVGDRTVNLFPSRTIYQMTSYKLLNDAGVEVDSSYSGYTPPFIEVEPNTTYTLTGNFTQWGLGTAAGCRVYFYQNTTFLSRSGNLMPAGNIVNSFTTPANCNFLAVQAQCINGYPEWDTAMLTEGTTPPETYVPYGYEMDISVSDGTSDTTTPIYIGDTPLDKDEYVDYAEQKVYRMINGTLTPTDPPVPLPALPTCEGETVVDYTGSGTAPEKALLKYRKENF